MQWTSNLCRICGHMSETYHTIHQKGAGIEFKLKKCLNLDVYKDDYKPKQICNNCMIKVNDYCDFIDLCGSTNAKFDSMILNKSNWHNDSIVDYNQQQKISVIVTSKHTGDNLDCTGMDLYKDSMLPLENLNAASCSLNDQTIIDIVENSNSYTIEDNMNNFITSSSYDKQYVTDFYSQNNVMQHSSNYPVPDNSCSASNVVINYSCQEKSAGTHQIEKSSCDYYYNKYNSMPSNLSYVSSEMSNTSCNNIGVDFSNYNSRSKKDSEVVQEVEKAVETVKIKKSNQKVVTVDELKKSVTVDPSKLRKEKKEKELFKCSHCDRKFMRRITLSAHMAIHTKLRPFICDVCNKSFAVRCDLTNHQRIHSNEYKCKHCPKSFPVPSKLERHVRTHTNQRPYVCAFKNCGRAFSDKRNLESHKHVHSDERSFKCDECGKTYKTKNRLKEHSLAHSDKLQYKCDVCGKAYRWKSNLTNHKRKHTGYFCPHCKKDCEKRSKLIKHRKECKAKKDMQGKI